MNKDNWILCQGICAFSFVAFCCLKRVPVWKIAVVIFFASWGWTWIHLYQLAVAKQQATLSRLGNIPETCQTQGWLSAIKDVVTGDSYNSKCEAYYSALLVNPVLEATPIIALSEMLSQFVLRPLQLLGESLGVYYKTLLDPLPLVWKIPCLLLGTLILCFLCLLIFRYRIKAPFSILTIEPSSSNKQNKRRRNSSSSSRKTLKEGTSENNDVCANNKKLEESGENKQDIKSLPYPTEPNLLDHMFPSAHKDKQ